MASIMPFSVSIGKRIWRSIHAIELDAAKAALPELSRDVLPEKQLKLSLTLLKEQYLP